ncbi:sensor histidine kinase [Cellvibrio sp. KY-GH-1]|uniref:sensor histidine kinase n=1 Tax=Cellvibrio sp. KY-GH-1 TaxID=2303332 RepID=UPI00124583E3|nr:HAMP domain-containing sensor histidine kinase [Cellvibrio sp. KY-GH-1]QEY16351.1 sensor histidine kinase [Cellvibrio sp. KY-GH-1]
MKRLAPGLFSNLCARLALAFVALFLVLGIAFLALTHWSNNRYYQEVTQNLNQSLAMYIVQRAPLIQNGIVNTAAMTELATLVMTVNPIVEVYLLDPGGKVLTHTLPADTQIRAEISTQPLQNWLNKSQPFPIMGDNPRAGQGERVFSVWPVMDNEHVAGYLYVILGGQNMQSLSESLRGSYILKQSLAGLAVILLFAIISAVLIFAVLTSPLRQLAQQMDNFQHQELHLRETTSEPNTNIRDEIAYLSSAFTAMRNRIQEQMRKLEDTDRLRRELISNVSHDLRTPLSSMQGYLEMLMRPAITAEERHAYMDIAFKHCRRLTQLVKELFELSKFDAGRITLELENFSLAELLQDVVQKYSLTAQQKNIALCAPHTNELYVVNADIALIERVLENLIDNALRYTPENGRVEITLSKTASSVEIGVLDNGIGLSDEDIPYIFERYYRAQKPAELHQQSTGLGLAIVKKILELHGSVIVVESKQYQGAWFKFPLPLQQSLNKAVA